MNRLYVLPLIFCLGLSACAFAPQQPQVVSSDYQQLQAYWRNYIQQQMKQHDVTGLSVALVDDQQLVWSAGFGKASETQAASAQTVYRVGPISKLFTDTAVMQLREQNKLDIDVALQRYIPEFSVKAHQNYSAPITLRNLMTHHSGLPRDYLQGAWTAQPASFRQLVTQTQTQYAVYPPNTLLSYSNLGIGLVGVAIENVSGVAFADYMQKNLLAPMGMQTASFETGLSASPLMAQAYFKGKLAQEPSLSNVPAGGLNASVLDLSQLLKMMFAEGKLGAQQIIQPASVTEMLRRQNQDVVLDMDAAVGLGWFLNTPSSLAHAGKVAGHTGATPNFNSSLMMLPEHKLGVVVLSNANGSADAVDKISKELLRLALQTKTGLAAPKPSNRHAASVWQAAQKKAFIGDYTTIMGNAQIQPLGDHLQVHAMDEELDLVPHDDQRAYLEYSFLGLYPVSLGELGDAGLGLRQLAGREVMTAKVGDKETLVGQRLQEAKDIAPFRSRLGTYRIRNQGQDYGFVDKIELLERNNRLVLAQTFKPELGGKTIFTSLLPLTDDQALLLGPLNDMGETVTCHAPLCEFAGYELEKVE